MTGAIKKFLLVLCSIISLINKLFPKSKHRVLIYSNLGFRDNGKALFDYLIENQFNDSFKIIVSTDDYKDFKSTKMKNVKFKGNGSAVFSYLRSRFVFYTFGKLPITPTKNQQVINLWHGMPLKTIGNLEKENAVKGRYYSQVLATSNFFADYMKKAFNCNKALIAGQPRNDELYKKQDIELFEGFSKIIMWLPTFRKCSKMNYFDSDRDSLLPYCDLDDLAFINTHLAKQNALLYIKLHPLDDFDEKNAFELSNIILNTHSDFAVMQKSLYSMLAKSDALITDYSSVYFDYLLLDKPIAFTVDDIEEYSGKRGFLFDNPLDYMPGEIIKDKQGILNFLNKTVSGQDDYKQARHSVNDLCNAYKDGGYTKNLLEQIGLKK